MYLICCCFIIARKTEKPSDTTVPEGFKENFPSLKEQEKMSKREREELERRQREEICDGMWRNDMCALLRGNS